MQWLTADDDNGNLNDGTPHMTAHLQRLQPPRHRLRHADAGQQRLRRRADRGADPRRHRRATSRSSLSWNSVAGRHPLLGVPHRGPRRLRLRQDARSPRSTGLSYTDTQVANGRNYYYNVVAAGASTACFGRASNCVHASPRRRRADAGLQLSCSPSSLTVAQGGSATSTCTVTSTNGFNSAVDLSCTGLPAGSTCGFGPTR